MKYDSVERKIKVLIVSIVITGLLIYAFCADNSMEWDISKIIFCVIGSLWGFFLAPMIMYIINWFKTASMEEAFMLDIK